MSEFLKPSGATVASGTIKQPIVECITYTDYNSGTTSGVLFGTRDPTRSNENKLIQVDTSVTTHTRYKVLKDCNVNVVTSMTNSSISSCYVDLIHCDSTGTVIKRTDDSTYSSFYGQGVITTKASVGDYFYVITSATVINNIQCHFSITATAIEESAPNFTVSLPVSKDNNKTYDQTQVSVTGFTGLNYAKFFPYRTIDKTTNLPIWRLAFNLMGTYTHPNNTTKIITINGITFPVTGGNGQAVTTSPEGHEAGTRAFTNQGLNSITVSNLSGVTYTGMDLSGDVVITGKPTWADDWNEPGCYVGNVPREQVAIVQYRGNGTRTTLSTTPVAMPLTTIKGDTSIVSIASNQFTLQAGEYDIDTGGFFFVSGGSTIVKYGYIYSITDSIEIDRDTPSYPSTTTAYAPFSGRYRISLSSTKIFEYRHVLSQAGTSYLGDNAASPNDLNGFIKIRKLA